MTRGAIRGAVLVAATSLLTSVVAGCGTGMDAPTSQQLPSVPGASARDASISVQNATVVFEPEGYRLGESAPVELPIFNNSSAPVRLVEATSGGATSVSVEAAGTADPIPGDGDATDGDATGGDAEAGELEIPAGGYTAATLLVSGLTQPLNGTSAVPLTLTFDNGAELSLNVPMAPPLEELPRGPSTFEEEEH